MRQAVMICQDNDCACAEVLPSRRCVGCAHWQEFAAHQAATFVRAALGPIAQPAAQPLKSAHAALLNRLSEMQAAPYYATARDTLAQAERVILQQEEEIAVSDKLLAERNRVLEAIPACDAHGSQCVPHAMDWVASAPRAFEIADAAMFELLLSEGVPDGGVDATEIGFADESCMEVPELAQASPAMREAFDWLKDRGYVELGSDKDGEFVQVVRRPGEDS